MAEAEQRVRRAEQARAEAIREADAVKAAADAETGRARQEVADVRAELDRALGQAANRRIEQARRGG